MMTITMMTLVAADLSSACQYPLGSTMAGSYKIGKKGASHYAGEETDLLIVINNIRINSFDAPAQFAAK